MPPVRKPPPAHPQSTRCRYVDAGGTRCRRIATIDGGLCRQCALTVSMDLDPGMRKVVGDLDRELARRGMRPMVDIVNGIVGMFAGARLRTPPIVDPGADPRSRSSPPPRSSSRGPTPHQAPPPRARPTPPPDPLLEARKVLGFDPGDKLTAERVSVRRKKLAQIYHPDAGGSLEHMTRVNAAADALLAKLS